MVFLVIFGYHVVYVILSPILFNLYVDDLLVLLHQSDY